jgi:hypothetical protein
MLQEIRLENNPLEPDFLKALPLGLKGIQEVLQARVKTLQDLELKKSASSVISMNGLFPESNAPLDNSHLLEQIQWGLKVSLQKLQVRPSRQSFLEGDFLRKTIFNIKDPQQPSRMFVFRSYMDEVFRNLRQTRYGIDENQFLQAMLGPVSELGVSGRSGSFLYQTQCGSYILKTIPTKESQFLRKIMKSYYHVSRTRAFLTKASKTTPH